MSEQTSGKAGTLRPTIIAGNWKMNLVRNEVLRFADRLQQHYSPSAGDSGSVEDSPSGAPLVMLFPSSPFLVPLADKLLHTPVIVGAQDLHPRDAGAHTGDVSARQLRSAGATWALCGHSERRHDHQESDQLVAMKVQAALEGGLAPMVCVGESLEERESERTQEVLARQLSAVLDGCPDLAVSDGGNSPWALAYEPVWAIGTGRTATPEIAQEAHTFLRSCLAERIGTASERLPILYGGSAKPANCESLLAEIDVDGLLIGGASLDSDSFLDMIRRCG